MFNRVSGKGSLITDINSEILSLHILLEILYMKQMKVIVSVLVNPWGILKSGSAVLCLN